MNKEILKLLYKDHTKSDYTDNSSNNRFTSVYNISKSLDRFFWENISVLDYGCGPCNFLKWANYNIGYPKKYYGYDIRSDTIEYAKSIYNNDNFTFSDELPKIKEWDLVLLLGTISYKFNEDIIYCKKESIKILLDSYSYALKSYIFTLPRKDYNQSDNIIIRYDIDEILNIIEILGSKKYIIDAKTLRNEFIIGISKVD